MDPRRRRAHDWLELGPILVPRRRAVPNAAPPGQSEPVQLQPVQHESPPRERPDPWLQLQAEVRVCTACELSTSRRQTVFGVGPRTASCMVIGEAPGAEEDQHGEAFVGQAGRLLDQMLAAIDLSRDRDVFICNVLKCRPPGNRNPTPGEVASCAGFLQRQIAQIRPRVLFLLGGFAVRSILETEASVGSQRGRVHRRRFGDLEVAVVVSYHPAYLLRNLPEKRKSWEDLLLLADELVAIRGTAAG